MPSWIKASAPGKLFLLGEHAILYGSPAIITSVDQRISLTLIPRNDPKILVRSGNINWQTDLRNYRASKKLDLISFIIGKYQNYLDNGFLLRVDSEFSAELGLGSSAALTVALTAALQELIEIPLDKNALLKKAVELHRQFQKGGSGGDIASSISGSIIYFIASSLTVLHLDCTPSLFAVYSGRKQKTMDVVNLVRKKAEQNPGQYSEIFSAISEIVELSAESLKNMDWEKTGYYMKKNHKLLSEMGVTTPEIDSLVESLSSIPGVYGAKISGAGLGDCIIGLGIPEYVPKGYRFFKIQIPETGIIIEKN